MTEEKENLAGEAEEKTTEKEMYAVESALFPSAEEEAGTDPGAESAQETGNASGPGAEPEEPEEGPSGAKRREDDPLQRQIDALRAEQRRLVLNNLKAMIDHTLLKQTATKEEIDALCDEAVAYGFRTVCVQPVYVRECCGRLRNHPDIRIACVVGFPMGENAVETKVYETKRALKDGADEIDAVLCISAVKNGDYRYIKKEVRSLVRAAGEHPVKIILEASLLTDEELRKTAEIVCACKAAFLKTGTGYFGGGATLEQVSVLREVSSGRAEVKASGGIRTAKQMRELVDAGASRIGTSSGPAIVEELKAEFFPPEN